MVCWWLATSVGVQAAIDVDDGLGLARQGVRLLVADAARERQAPRDVLIMIELRQVGGVGDEGDEPVAAARGLAHVDQLDAVRRRRQLAEIAQRVFVSGQVEIVAGLVAQHRFRRGWPWPRRRRGPE